MKKISSMLSPNVGGGGGCKHVMQLHATVILLHEELMRTDGMKVKIFKRLMLPE